jgi:hypothetical protein
MLVLPCLTDEQMSVRLQACQEFVQSMDDNRSLLDSIVMGYETWCFQYDSQTKDKTWSATRQALQDIKILISEVKKQSDVGHIL